jgi:hypothetical protein
MGLAGNLLDGYPDMEAKIGKGSRTVIKLLGTTKLKQPRLAEVRRL